jgi:hypothetical protein
MASCVRTRPGFDLQGDDRQYRVANFHIPAFKRNVSASVRRCDEGIFCVTCEKEHCFNGNDPICVFITDQNFPPSLPTEDGRCCVILRLEDCLLTEQPGVLKEFFGNRTGYLPEGSVLLFGWLSHLAMRGLESSAEETVRAFKVFFNMLKSGCSVAHVVHVPLGGVQSDGLIRDLYDLDSWLRSGIISTAASLPASRECFWRLAVEENPVSSSANNMERALFMPESLTKSSKIRIVSGATNNLLPDCIGPISENFEKELVGCILNEISETYAIEIDRNPALNRCSDDQVFYSKDTHDDRIFIVGASHTTRLVGGLAEKCKLC